MSDSRSAGRLRLLHLREVAEAKSDEMQAERGRFERLARKESKPRVVSSFNLFQTPEELAQMAVEIAQPRGRILEPSAGLGRLYLAIRGVTVDPITLVEVSADCCGVLFDEIEGDEAAVLVQRDFLACTVSDLGMFDSIVMNPPFKMGTDIKHIDHALSLLAPGGRLVTFCYDGTKQRKRFEGHDYRQLPAGSFKSEGTRADTAIVVIQK